MLIEQHWVSVGKRQRELQAEGTMGWGGRDQVFLTEGT